jgi:hypothetical protein
MGDRISCICPAEEDVEHRNPAERTRAIALADPTDGIEALVRVRKEVSIFLEHFLGGSGFKVVK